MTDVLGSAPSQAAKRLADKLMLAAANGEEWRTVEDYITAVLTAPSNASLCRRVGERHRLD